MRVNLLVTNDFTEFVYSLSKNMQVNLPVTPNDFTESVYPLSKNMRVNLLITNDFTEFVYPLSKNMQANLLINNDFTSLFTHCPRICESIYLLLMISQGLFTFYLWVNIPNTVHTNDYSESVFLLSKNMQKGGVIFENKNWALGKLYQIPDPKFFCKILLINLAQGLRKFWLLPLNEQQQFF